MIQTNPASMDSGRVVEKKTGIEDGEKWVYDSSVDHKGRIPLRKSTGAWKAALFIIAIEFTERLTYYGIAIGLITYLTKVLGQDVKTAAKNVNYWIGVTTMMPLLGGFLADAYIGRFLPILVSSIVYILGLGLLTMSQYVPILKPCTGLCTSDHHSKASRVHEVVFFLSIYMISVGTGGHKPSLESFGADQFDENHPEERKKKMSYFNWWNFGLCCGILLGVTVIVYFEDFVSWGAADIVLTSIMAISFIVFFIGKPFYRHQVPRGSPLTPIVQVIVAAIAKRKMPLPGSPAQLYELNNLEKGGMRHLKHTSCLRFLDRAAVVEDPCEEESKWRVATVTQVEETKLILNLIPIWLATLVFGICVGQTNTFFVKQGSTMNRQITNNFTIPSASLFAFATLAMIITVSVFDKIIEPILRKIKNDERGMNILLRVGIGMAFSVVGMAIAAVVEMKRLHSVHQLSVFWLAPQFIILGIADGFAVVGLQEFFYDQVPDTMRSLGIAFYLSVLGAGSFLSSLLITATDHVTDNLGKSWFAKDLNNSRLDNFYWLVGVLSFINLGVYMLLTRNYTYKNVELKRVAGVDFSDDGDGDCIP